ncbi:hypothetical protein [Terrabacter sp. NPDC080008]|uniref:hypothetical protein n=1 Tax=Terrabacter sp. NPDC080008 TaxID=3155176 RepID=UPI00344B5FDC
MSYYDDDTDEQGQTQDAIAQAVEAARAANEHLQQLLSQAGATSGEAPQSVLSPEDVEAMQRMQGAFGGVRNAPPYSNDIEGRAAAAASSLGRNSTVSDAVEALRAQGFDVQSTYSG